MEATAPNRSDLDTIYDRLPIGVMALNSDQRVAVWNLQMESWSGVTRVDVINRTLGEVFSGFDDVSLAERLQGVFELGTSISLIGESLPLPFRVAEDCDRTLQATVAPISGTDGSRWALFTMQDVSSLTGQMADLQRSMQDSILAVSRAEESKRAIEHRNDQLTELNRDLEQFAYLASHDLQEPLRTLTSFSTFLKADLGEDLPEDAARDLEHIVAAAARMRRLIDDLLALSRVSRSEMSWSPTSLSSCVVEALEQLQAPMNECKPTILGAEDLPTVRADRRLLTQVFLNLLSNAMKFADPTRPCTINVCAERDGAGWLVKTTDNGIGFAEAYATKIFAPFQRLHGADKYPGSGMGLAICKRAVSRHGGMVWAVPNETVGACIQFTLPDRQNH